MLPKSCEGEPLGTRTMRSKSFTSCLLDDVKPAGSVHARTKVTGMDGGALLHVMVKAESTDDDENVSDVYNIL